VKSNPYETEQYLSEYLLFHYGRPSQLCPFGFVPKEALRFHERIREECLLRVRPSKADRRQRRNVRLPSRSIPTRALDLGCGVGRFTFELGLVVNEVLGLDNSKRFITAARRMAARRALTARVRESGAQFRKTKLVLPKRLRTAAVRFAVSDAMNLSRFANGAFDVVAAINLICRLPNPKRFFQQLRHIVRPGGQLLIASPFSWLGSYTPPRKWLDARQVIRALAPHFKLARRREIPFVIREHRRKYQLVISEVLTFVRSERA
jgi:SAM-dependent methyltransferase